MTVGARRYAFDRESPFPADLVDALRDMMGQVHGVKSFIVDVPDEGPPSVHWRADIDALPRLDRLARDAGGRRVL